MGNTQTQQHTAQEAKTRIQNAHWELEKAMRILLFDGEHIEKHTRKLRAIVRARAALREADL